MDKRNHSSVGNTAAMMLKTLNVDIAFISTSSWICSTGFLPRMRKGSDKNKRYWMLLAVVCWFQTVVSSANGMFRVCPLNQLHDIICDDQLPTDVVQRITEQNIKLHLIKT